MNDTSLWFLHLCLNVNTGSTHVKILHDHSFIITKTCFTNVILALLGPSFSSNKFTHIDFIVTIPLITHLSLYTRLKPTYYKKRRIMGLVYIFHQWGFNCQARGPRFKPRWPLILIFFHFFNSNKKMIETLTKIHAKITIIIVKNKELIILLLFINVKKSHYPYSLIRRWLQLFAPMSGLVTIRSTFPHNTISLSHLCYW